MGDLWHREKDGALFFKVHVQPRAARNQIRGLHGEALKLSLTAPPVDGAANQLCRDFLARQLDMPRAAVSVVAGLKSRTKTVRVEGFTLEKLHRCLAGCL